MMSLYQAERQIIELWEQVRLLIPYEDGYEEIMIGEMDAAVQELRDLHYPEEPTNE